MAPLDSSAVLAAFENVCSRSRPAKLWRACGATATVLSTDEPRLNVLSARHPERPGAPGPVTGVAAQASGGLCPGVRPLSPCSTASLA